MKPLPKEKFFEILKYLKATAEFENGFAELLQDTDKDHEFIEPFMFTDSKLESHLIDLLEHIYQDDCGWIRYWIYEMDFGQDKDLNPVDNRTGKIIDISSIENLYYYLISQSKSAIEFLED